MNKDHHEGIKLATEELQRVLDVALQRVQSGSKVDRVTEHYARLAAGGVTPLHILAMVTAVALFDRDNPNFMMNTRAYQFAVARAVCGLVPIHQMPFGALTIAAIGQQLVERYAPLIAVVIQAIDDVQRREAERHAALTTPINLPDNSTPER